MGVGFVTEDRRYAQSSGINDNTSVFYWVSNSPYSLPFGGKAHLMIAGKKIDS